MSAHVWHTLKFKPETLELFLGAYHTAREGGLYGPIRSLDCHAACTFAGYVVESTRQKGSLMIDTLWIGAQKSNHRYSRGPNACWYNWAGRKLLVATLRAQGLAGDTLSLLGAREQQLLNNMLDALEEQPDDDW